MLAIIDERLPLPCRASLEERGFSLLPLPPFPRLSSPVASHPDMLLLKVGERLFCHEEYYAIAKDEIQNILKVSGLSLCLTDDAVSEDYPHDVSLNLVFTGNLLIGKSDTAAKKVKDYAASCHIPLLSVKQGYAKCSSVVLENAIITADTGIESAAKDAELDTLLISNGNVTLPPYPYGFLGGASGVYGKTVFFCGDLRSHSDGTQIEAFCRKHGYEVISLSHEPLFDVGTVMFF